MTISQDVLVQFSPTNAIIGVAGYFVAPEGTQHAIVGFRDGTLTEVYWKTGQGVHQDTLGNFPNGVVGVGDAEDDLVAWIVELERGPQRFVDVVVDAAHRPDDADPWSAFGKTWCVDEWSSSAATADDYQMAGDVKGSRADAE